MKKILLGMVAVFALSTASATVYAGEAAEKPAAEKPAKKAKTKKAPKKAEGEKAETPAK